MRTIPALGLGVVFVVLGAGVSGAQIVSVERQSGGASAAPAGSPGRPRIGVAVRVSTLGVGVDVATPVSNHANFRVGFNAFGLSHDFDSDGLTLAAHVKMRSLVTQFDWYPFNGGFHLSPGLMLYNGIGIEATMTAPTSQTFSLGDETLVSNPANPLNGNAAIKYQRVAPTIALGWGNLIPRNTSRRWSIPFELGLVYTRAPAATLSLKGSACRPNGTNCRDLAADSGLQNDIATQQGSINKDLEPLKIYPVLSIGFSHTF